MTQRRDLRKGARTTFEAIVAAGETPIGIFQSLGDPAITEIIGSSGFDFVIIDGEHSPMGPAEWVPLVRTAEIFGLIPVVRIWENTRPLIQKAIDVGAEAIIVPHVDSAAHAEAAVAAIRFPANGGVRSVCPGNHGSNYGMQNWNDFVEHTAQNLLIIPIVESAAGAQNLREIAEVDGIDYIFFGNGDLASEFGVELDDPIITRLWQDAVLIARETGVTLIASDTLPGLVPGQAGVVVYGMDSLRITDAFTSLATEAHNRFGAIAASATSTKEAATP